MNINTIITLKYDELASFCKKNVIKQREVSSKYLNDIEEIDLLHTMLIRFLNKYKDFEFENLEVGYNTIKTEFLGEKNNYWQIDKPQQLSFISISDLVNSKALNKESNEE